MYGFIRELYSFTQERNGQYKEIDQWEKEEILGLLSTNGEGEKPLNFEKFPDMLFKSASIAEEAGFIKGFLYAYKIGQECNHTIN